MHRTRAYLRLGLTCKALTLHVKLRARSRPAPLAKTACIMHIVCSSGEATVASLRGCLDSPDISHWGGCLTTDHSVLSASVQKPREAAAPTADEDDARVGSNAARTEFDTLTTDAYTLHCVSGVGWFRNPSHLVKWLSGSGCSQVDVWKADVYAKY